MKVYYKQQMEQIQNHKYLIIYAIYQQLKCHTNALERNTYLLKELSEIDEQKIADKMYRQQVNLTKEEKKRLDRNIARQRKQEEKEKKKQKKKKIDEGEEFQKEFSEEEEVNDDY